MAATAIPLLPFDPLPTGTPRDQFFTTINLNALRSEVVAKPALSFEATQPGSPADPGLYVLSAAWGDEVEGTLAYYSGGTWYYFEPFIGLLKRIGATDYYTFDPDSSSQWQAFAPGAPVDSVNGQTGAVVLDSADIPDAVSTLTNSSGTVTVDCSLGKSFQLTLAANVTTLTLSNLAGAGKATEIEIEFKQNGTGGFTVALPASFKALGGSDTAVALAANAVTVLSAKTFDNGTTWRYAMQESA